MRGCLKSPREDVGEAISLPAANQTSMQKVGQIRNLYEFAQLF